MPGCAGDKGGIFIGLHSGYKHRGPRERQMARNLLMTSLLPVDALAQPAADRVIVDCRFDLAAPEAGEQAYRRGHIPGAWYAHLDRDLSGPLTPASGRHPLPDPTALVALFSRWGIGRDTLVVCHDDAGGACAARLWWLLRWMGHHRVALLDGGLQAWQARNLPLSTDIPTPGRQAFMGTPGRMPVIDAEGIARGLREGSLALLDARARSRYLGQGESIDPVAGHVPGALSTPFQDNLVAGGHFRDPESLRIALAGKVASASLVAVMCGSGVTACHVIFALERAGLGTASLYPGSWSEWIRDPVRPVSTEADDPAGGLGT